MHVAFQTGDVHTIKMVQKEILNEVRACPIGWPVCGRRDFDEMSLLGVGLHAQIFKNSQRLPAWLEYIYISGYESVYTHQDMYNTRPYIYIHMYLHRYTMIHILYYIGMLCLGIIFLSTWPSEVCKSHIESLQPHDNPLWGLRPMSRSTNGSVLVLVVY